MAKIRLGAAPKSFKKTVSIQLLDGSTGTIECEFRYRSAREFGEFVDRISADTDVPALDAEAKLSVAKLLANREETNAGYLNEVLVGWNLDEEFTPDNVKRLCAELPAAAIAIIDVYRAACVEGRLKN